MSIEDILALAKSVEEARTAHAKSVKGVEYYTRQAAKRKAVLSGLETQMATAKAAFAATPPAGKK